ncbi:MAG TPA: hypothetical protein VHA53_04395 [Nitrolancea sp.]|nr:hypothetical protein [Nitrolancea sp.]
MNILALISALVILLIFVPLFGALVAAVLGFCGWLFLRDHQADAAE